MAVIDYDKMDDMQIDMLKEIANIGTGNAATSLATMLGKTVNITVPKISFLDYSTISDSLGGPEHVMAGLMLMLDKDVKGMMILLMQEDFAQMAIHTLLGQDFTSFTDLDEMSMSAMCEIGNIVAASYVNAVSLCTGLTIDISPPEICIDMVGSILSVPAIHFAQISDKVIFIEGAFINDTNSEGSNILLIPEAQSLDVILDKLGMSI